MADFDEDKFEKMLEKLGSKASNVPPERRDKLLAKMRELRSRFDDVIDQLEDEAEPQNPRPPGCQGPPCPVPRTGQTKCWTSDYRPVKCGDGRIPVGQDGSTQFGLELPSPRFRDCGDGTVTDLLTGLVWLKNADMFGEVTWDQARIIADRMQSGSVDGLSDGSQQKEWRLPTIKELFSLIHYDEVAPIVDPSYPARETVKPSIYWTSTTFLPDPTQAWMMTLGIGPTVFMLKNSPCRMWPVRNGSWTSVPKTGQTQTFGFEQTGQDGGTNNLYWGVDWPSKRFLPNEDGQGTVTDALTGLVWLQNANPFGWQTWEGALKKCHELAGDGSCEGLADRSRQGQWRLPNVREMESLVDYGRAGPSLPDEFRTAFQPDPDGPIGSTVQPSSYWTSTTVADAPSQAMFIILGVGPVIFENKEHPFFVWPVRNHRTHGN